MPITERICGRCGRRCRRGWLRVHEQGAAKAPSVNRSTDDETVYCSERCLRTKLFDAAGNMQLIVDQQREIDRLKEARRQQYDDEDWSTNRENELRTLLNDIVDQAVPLAYLDPQAASHTPEDRERLSIAAHNILRLVAPHIRRRQER